ncbi:MAG: hypothetical protein ACRDHP_04480, partial [Ktedonobacterales bacterium]
MATPPPPPNNPPPPPRHFLGRRARIVPRGTPTFRSARRNLHFKGQMPNERVIWIRRKHWIFLLTPAWPALLSLLALVLITAFLGTAAGAGPILTILALALFLVMTIRWVVKDLGDWVFHYYILTNQRAISSKGFFRPDRREAVLKSVVQVIVQRPNPLLMAMGIGDVIVRVIGASVDMPGVSHPRAIADSILAIQESPHGPA